MCLSAHVCRLSHLYQPRCNDRGTSQTPDGPGLFAGVHVWKFSPLQVLPAPCCSRLPLLCLCGYVQTCCGPVMKPSVSWKHCHWWSKKDRGRPRRQEERGRDAVDSIECWAGVFCYGIRDTVYVCMHACVCEWSLFLALEWWKPTHFSSHISSQLTHSSNNRQVIILLLVVV